MPRSEGNTGASRRAQHPLVFGTSRLDGRRRAAGNAARAGKFPERGVSEGAGIARTGYLSLGGVVVVAAVSIAPVHGWQVSPEEHAKHHPGAQAAQPTPAPKATPTPDGRAMGGAKGMAMMASSARLDELVLKMNAAQGQAKVDAMAELLTALVHQHQTMHGGMDQMMSKMKNKDGAAPK